MWEINQEEERIQELLYYAPKCLASIFCRLRGIKPMVPENLYYEVLMAYRRATQYPLSELFFYSLALGFSSHMTISKHWLPPNIIIPGIVYRICRPLSAFMLFDADNCVVIRNSDNTLSYLTPIQPDPNFQSSFPFSVLPLFADPLRLISRGERFISEPSVNRMFILCDEDDGYGEEHYFMYYSIRTGGLNAGRVA